MLTYANPLTRREFPPHQDPSSLYTNSGTIIHQNSIFLKKPYSHDTVFKQNSEAGAILFPSYKVKHLDQRKVTLNFFSLKFFPLRLEFISLIVLRSVPGLFPLTAFQGLFWFGFSSFFKFCKVSDFFIILISLLHVFKGK